MIDQDVKSIRNIGHFLRAALFAVGPDRGRLALAVAIAFICGVVQTALMVLLATIAVVLSSRIYRTIWITYLPVHLSEGSLVLAASVLVLIVLALAAPLAKLQASLSARALTRMRTRVVSAYLGASHSYLGIQREGYFSQLIGEYSLHADNIVQQISQFCTSGATLLVVLATALVVSPKTASILVLAIVTGTAIIGPVVQRIRAEAKNRAAVNRQVSSRCSQVARLSEEIFSYNVNDAAAHEINRKVVEANEVLRRIGFRNALVPTLYQYGTLAIILVFVGALVALDPGRHPSFAVLALLLSRALGYCRQLLVSVQSGSRDAYYVEALQTELALLDENQTSNAGADNVRFAGLTFDKVSFAYTPGQDVLRDISFWISPGEVVGLVGPSGGGKSTLCALLLKLRTPTAGVISTGGMNIQDISPGAWASLAAIALQDSKLLLGTVADNIRFFREGFSIFQVEQAARAAHIHHEIMMLPQGYDTIIGPGVRGMSGGQRQRVAIARAILGKPQFLVLDEPTSALDQESEKLIGRTLMELKGQIAILIVAHRPAALEACDRVLRLDGGRLLEAASPPQLV